jgi:AraC-like DNA-binding protein
MMSSGQLQWLEQINPQVHDVWWGRWKPGTIEPRRTLIDHELVLFAEGVCEVELADQRVSCPRGTFLVIPPGVPHVTRGGALPITRYCVHFDWITSRPAPQTMLWSFPPKPFDRSLARLAPRIVPNTLLRGSYKPKMKIDRLMKTLCSRWRAPGSSERHLCRPLLLDVLLQLFIDLSPRSVGEPPIELAERVRHMLSDFPPAKRVDSIMAEIETLGYSYAHVCRAFTKRYGIGPLRYVTQSRMDYARVMLQENKMKVVAIANELGYKDVGYFIRVFRHYVGSTPGEYARTAADTTSLI